MHSNNVNDAHRITHHFEHFQTKTKSNKEIISSQQMPFRCYGLKFVSWFNSFVLFVLLAGWFESGGCFSFQLLSMQSSSAMIFIWNAKKESVEWNVIDVNCMLNESSTDVSLSLSIKFVLVIDLILQYNQIKWVRRFSTFMLLAKFHSLSLSLFALFLLSIVLFSLYETRS